MKLLILSDIHANHDALRAVPEDYDELWVLGDLVNYGPEPAEAVAWVRARASLVVQGNHDHAVAHDDDTTWSPRYRALSEATRRYTSSVLSTADKAYLGSLPERAEAEREGTTFHLLHGTPADPLRGRWPADETAWAALLAGIEADVLLCGHSHVPMLKQVGGKVVLNPGSVGQPRNGRAGGSYAVWQDGTFTLRAFEYPVEDTIGKIDALPLKLETRAELAAILRTGTV
ncbi:metallophosphoesterase family protein [Salinarimonas soli]|uniref:metallophosphoesterase family protein n=1 Tax=Salinarimonas soli TaxID=1638099 RepID=UPI001661B123|nr:metallophosphoesterase family protein [Salinarimonas soli]